MKWTFPWIVSAAVLAAGPTSPIRAGEVVPVPPEPLSLAWCLERASEANPEIATDAAAAEAAEHRITPAGALDDPRISYQALNVPTRELDFASTPMSGNQVGLAQKLPFPGLLRNREKAARAGALAAAERVADRQILVRAAAERAWAELGFAQRALRVTDRNIELLRQLTKIAEAKYKVGKGLQQDVLRAQVELTALVQERLRRMAAIRTAEAALARLLDLPPETSFPMTDALEEDTALPSLDDLLARLEEVSPRLAALRARIEESERRRGAVELEGRPDFDLGIGYRFRESVPGDPVSGQDFLSANVTIRLPVNRGKWRERVAEQEALVRQAKFAYTSERARLRDAVRAAYAHLQRADEETSLVRTGLVPQASQSLESSRSGYEVDKVDFLSLIDSQIRLLNAELGLVRAVADRRAAYAALEAALGETLR